MMNILSLATVLHNFSGSKAQRISKDQLLTFTLIKGKSWFATQRFDANQGSSPQIQYPYTMVGATKCGKPYIGLLAAMLIMLPNVLRAEDRHSDNTALLAIFFDKGRAAAGMMCVGTEFSGIDGSGSRPNCPKFEAPDSNMCRRSSASILNPNVLAFDVTFWPRRAIAELNGRLQLMADPLNYDFSKARLAGLHVRRIEETEGEESFSASKLELSSGCYLLIIAPGTNAALGS